MRIALSFRQLLKDKISEEKYAHLVKTTDERGEAFAFIQKEAATVKNMDDVKFKSFVRECNELYMAGFHGSRWDEMGLILARYT